MLLDLLLVLLILVCIALGAVVLLQRSEGGALGMGGGPSGFLTARGAGDLLTRTTWILGGVFFVLCLGLTIVQGRMHQGSSVVDRLKIDPLSSQPLTAPAPAAPAAGPAAPAATGFEAPAPQVNAAPTAVPAPAASRRNASKAAGAPDAALVPAPQVTTAASPAPRAATAPAATPPGTDTGPVDPVASAVGGAPADGPAPPPRTH